MLYDVNVHSLPENREITKQLLNLVHSRSRTTVTTRPVVKFHLNMLAKYHIFGFSFDNQYTCIQVLRYWLLLHHTVHSKEEKETRNNKESNNCTEYEEISNARTPLTVVPAISPTVVSHCLGRSHGTQPGRLTAPTGINQVVLDNRWRIMSASSLDALLIKLIFCDLYKRIYHLSCKSVHSSVYTSS